VLQTGDTLVGRYEIDSLLGRGGMSSVYSGFDRTLGRVVAIKILAAELVRG
jgi:serine/threonine protein kinase